MKFFRITQDDRDIQSIIIKGLINIPQYKDISKGNITALPFANCYNVVSKKQNVYPDILLKQLFMVSRDVFNLLKMFLGDKLNYRCMLLVDNKYQTNGYFYIPQLPVVANCLSPESSMNIDGSVVEKVVIQNNYKYPDIFCIPSAKENIYIVSLHMAESLLRRDFSGFCLEKVFLSNSV